MSAKRSKRISRGDGWAFNPESEAPAKKPVSGRKLIRLRMEKRKGKATTILYEMEGVADLKNLAKALKNLVSAGGTAKDGKIEIQGEHRDRFRVYLSDEGYEVKG